MHGTTSTNPRVGKNIYPLLKANDYQICLQVLFAASGVRRMALNHRNMLKAGTHSTATDEKSKAAPVYVRILDAYTKYADSLNIYYNKEGFYLGNFDHDLHKTVLFLTNNRSQHEPIKVFNHAITKN